MATSQKSSEPPVITRHSLLSLYIPAAILALGTTMLVPALPVYAQSFGVSFGVASMLVVAASMGSLIAGLPTGYLLDRVGRRKIILAAPLGAALSSLLCVTAHSFPELLAYRFIGGVAAQMWLLGRLAIIADTGGDQQRGRQITGMYATDGVGRISGPLIGGLLATAWDVRLPFIVHAALCLVATIPSFKLIRETAPIGTRAASTAGVGSGRWRIPPWLLTMPIVTFLVVQFLGAVTR